MKRIALATVLVAASATAHTPHHGYQHHGHYPQPNYQPVAVAPMAAAPVYLMDEELFVVGHHLQNYRGPSSWKGGWLLPIAGMAGGAYIGLARGMFKMETMSGGKRFNPSFSNMILGLCIGGAGGARFGWKSVVGIYRWLRSNNNPKWQVDLRTISEQELERLLYGKPYGLKMQVFEARRQALGMGGYAVVAPVMAMYPEGPVVRNSEKKEDENLGKIIKKELKREREKAAMIEREREMARIAANTQTAALRN